VSTQRAAWIVCRQDLVVILRQRETILWTFLMPPVFFYFIGTITGSGKMSGPRRSDELALRASADAGFLVDELVLRLTEQDYAVIRPDDDPRPEARPFESYGLRALVPARFTERALAGEEVQIRVEREGGGLAGDYDAFRVRRAVYTVLADLVAAEAARADDAPLGPDDLARLRELPRALALSVAPAGERRAIPTGFEQTVPGTMVMFTLLVLLTSGATTLLVERRQGILLRLAAAPMTRGAVVLGKWGGKLLLGIVQIAFAMLLGSLAFGLDWGPALPMVALVMLAYASLIACLGVLLGTFARSEGQAIGLGVLAANVLGALGGCWWPIEVTPPFMQKLALFLPTGWAMDALHALVSFGHGPASALPHVVGMSLGALALGQVAARVFRFR
jgi:ABC-type Na+ efflux pump permease subunit